MAYLIDTIRETAFACVEDQSAFPGYKKDLIVQHLKDAICMDISNVHSYVFGQEEWSYADAPCVIPPLPSLWTEYTEPIGKGDIVRRGILFMSGDGKQENNFVYALCFFGHSNKRRGSEAVQLFGFSYWHDKEGNLEMPDKRTNWKRWADTLMRKKPPIPTPTESVPFYDYEKTLAHVVDQKRLSQPGVAERFYGSMRLSTITSLLAFSFANCKNVSLVKTREASLGLTGHQWRGMKSNTPPKVKVYTLDIGPVKKVVANANDGNSDATPRSLHICRGHFKDFTKGRGLFGKYTGRYWWPMQTRGDSSVGVVRKDYAVKPY